MLKINIMVNIRFGGSARAHGTFGHHDGGPLGYWRAQANFGDMFGGGYGGGWGFRPQYQGGYGFGHGMYSGGRCASGYGYGSAQFHGSNFHGRGYFDIGDVVAAPFRAIGWGVNKIFGRDDDREDRRHGYDRHSESEERSTRDMPADSSRSGKDVAGEQPKNISPLYTQNKDLLNQLLDGDRNGKNDAQAIAELARRLNLQEAGSISRAMNDAKGMYLSTAHSTAIINAAVAGDREGLRHLLVTASGEFRGNEQADIMPQDARTLAMVEQVVQANQRS